MSQSSTKQELSLHTISHKKLTKRITGRASVFVNSTQRRDCHTTALYTTVVADNIEKKEAARTTVTSSVVTVRNQTTPTWCYRALVCMSSLFFVIKPLPDSHIYRCGPARDKGGRGRREAESVDHPISAETMRAGRENMPITVAVASHCGGSFPEFPRSILCAAFCFGVLVQSATLVCITKHSSACETTQRLTKKKGKSPWRRGLQNKAQTPLPAERAARTGINRRNLESKKRMFIFHVYGPPPPNTNHDARWLKMKAEWRCN